MAHSEADEDFRLPLRPWLEKQINSGKYKGLEWEQSDGEAKLFRLPWVKKHFPDWEEYYRIFRAWADHSGRSDVDGMDDSKLKSNFRCALNRSAYFEEVTNRSQLQRQCGTYKVYRFLTPNEFRERKRNRSDAKATHEHNLNDDELKTIDKQGLHVLDSLGTSTSSCGNIDMDTSASLSTFTPIESATPQRYDLARDKIATVPPPSDLGEFSPALAISPNAAVVQPVWQSDVPMEDEPPVTNVSADSKSQNYMAPMLQQLQNAGFQKERMCECQVVITYGGEKVLEKYVTDMHKGCRIFYGNRDEQLRFLQSRNTSEDKLADFKLRGIRLPTLSKQSNTMSAILDKTDLGIVIRYNPVTYQLCAKRLCQSQVFFFSPHEDSESSEPRKLEREETVEIFSHQTYFVGYFGNIVFDGNSVPPEAEIALAVGIKPKSKMALPAMKGLKIELIPYALKFLMGNDNASSISLCFSNPTSVETLLRTIKEIRYPSVDKFKNFYL